MSKGQRVGLIVIALAIAVAAFLVLRSGDEESQQASAPAPSATQADGAAAEPDAEQRPDKPEEPPATKIEVEGGSPAGGVEKIEVDKGEDVRLEVASDAPAEVHVHGYDVFEEAEPGKPAKFDFPAELEGIFEIELEATHTPIAELRVNP